MVPAPVPSELQSSRPFTPSFAANSSKPFKFTRADSVEPVVPGLISFISNVPASVPSVFLSSLPFVSSDATKYKLPFTLVKPAGKEDVVPGLMSFTNDVPASVPSLFQSSMPVADVAAEKKTKYHIPLSGLWASCCLCRLQYLLK